METSLSMLPTLLHTLRKKMMESHNKIVESYGLTQMHIPYLMVLCNHEEGLAQKDMIGKIHLDKAHASRALKELVEKGIVIKEDIQTYKNKYFLSKKGFKLSNEMKVSSRNTHEKVFSILTDDERMQLENIIKKLTEQIMDNT